MKKGILKNAEQMLNERKEDCKFMIKNYEARLVRGNGSLSFLTKKLDQYIIALKGFNEIDPQSFNTYTEFAGRLQVVVDGMQKRSFDSIKDRRTL